MDCVLLFSAFLAVVLIPFLFPLMVLKIRKWYNYLILESVLFFICIAIIPFLLYDILNVQLSCIFNDTKIDLAFLLFVYFSVMVIPNVIALVVGVILWLKNKRRDANSYQL